MTVSTVAFCRLASGLLGLFVSFLDLQIRQVLNFGLYDCVNYFSRGVSVIADRTTPQHGVDQVFKLVIAQLHHFIPTTFPTGVSRISLIRSRVIWHMPRMSNLMCR